MQNNLCVIVNNKYLEKDCHLFSHTAKVNLIINGLQKSNSLFSKHLSLSECKLLQSSSFKEHTHAFPKKMTHIYVFT